MNKNYSDRYIIKSSDHLSWAIRARDVLLTLTLWCLYGYMMKDCVVFLTDVLNWMGDHDDTLSAYPRLRVFHTGLHYFETFVVMALLFVAWAMYNRIRFSGKVRRRAVSPVTAADVGSVYHVSADQVEKWHDGRLMTIYHDKNGRLTKIDIVRKA